MRRRARGGGGIFRPRSAARFGIRPLSCCAKESSSVAAFSGKPFGATVLRIGDVSRALSIAVQWSVDALGESVSLAASARRPRRSPGSFEERSGARVEMRTALMLLRSPSASSISATHSASSAAVRITKSSLSLPKVSSISSDRATRSPKETTVLRSLNPILSDIASAASARSSHEARSSPGRIPSAMLRIGSAGMGTLLSFANSLFCSAIAVRTAGRPPLTSCSAIDLCSSGTSARNAFRCLWPGLRRVKRGAAAAVSGRDSGRFRLLSVGRWTLASEAAPSPDRCSLARSSAGRGLRSPPSARAGRSGRRFSFAGLRSDLPRSPVSERSFDLGRCLRAYSTLVSCGADRGAGTISIIELRESSRFWGGNTASTKMPSISNVTSARTTSPTLAPS